MLHIRQSATLVVCAPSIDKYHHVFTAVNSFQSQQHSISRTGLPLLESQCIFVSRSPSNVYRGPSEEGQVTHSAVSNLQVL